MDVLLLGQTQYPWLEKRLDKAHITATSPEDQGHVETEIPDALPLSHSLEFFLFKERGGRARFAHPVVRSKRRSDPESSLMPSRDYCVGLISGVVNSFDGRSAYFTWKRDLLRRSRLKTERCSPDSGEAHSVMECMEAERVSQIDFLFDQNLTFLRSKESDWLLESFP
ncbi:hypothetical protein FNV43_RR08292 [Rhamnella rubrinervis]|uniref:Uncharacterized protein n=1 Tax=Rhamnella rubrinervis TaxID=2594499 RepID=A0A8K0MN91_9ROSA|nr:hypothetical protein FNV43_RR08292 [Rhamnella rubrinervis]